MMGRWFREHDFYEVISFENETQRLVAFESTYTNDVISNIWVGNVSGAIYRVEIGLSILHAEEIIKGLNEINTVAQEVTIEIINQNFIIFQSVDSSCIRLSIELLNRINSLVKNGNLHGVVCIPDIIVEEMNNISAFSQKEHAKLLMAPSSNYKHHVPQILETLPLPEKISSNLWWWDLTENSHESEQEFLTYFEQEIEQVLMPFTGMERELMRYELGLRYSFGTDYRNIVDKYKNDFFNKKLYRRYYDYLIHGGDPNLLFYIPQLDIEIGATLCTPLFIAFLTQNQELFDLLLFYHADPFVRVGGRNLNWSLSLYELAKFKGEFHQQKFTEQVDSPAYTQFFLGEMDLNLTKILSGFRFDSRFIANFRHSISAAIIRHINLNRRNRVDIQRVDIFNDEQSIITNFTISKDSRLFTKLQKLPNVNRNDLAKVKELYQQYCFEGGSVADLEAAFAADITGNNKILEIIYHNNEKCVVGFNIFEILSLKNKQEFLCLHCVSSYTDKTIRGIGLMPLLAFRLAFCLKRLNPEREVAVYFSALSYNSFSLAQNFAYCFPKNQSDFTKKLALNIVKSVEPKAEVFHQGAVFYITLNIMVRSDAGIKNFGLFSSVFNRVLLNKQQSQCQTERCRAVPVQFFIGDESFEKLNRHAANIGINFLDHMQRLSVATANTIFKDYSDKSKLSMAMKLSKTSALFQGKREPSDVEIPATTLASLTYSKL
jgi:hypothetical protein